MMVCVCIWQALSGDPLVISADSKHRYDPVGKQLLVCQGSLAKML